MVYEKPPVLYISMEHQFVLFQYSDNISLHCYQLQDEEVVMCIMVVKGTQEKVPRLDLNKSSNHCVFLVAIFSL